MRPATANGGRFEPPFSRRALLKALGAGAAITPFLPLLNASGQETQLPKRLLLVYTPDGTAASQALGGSLDWRPGGTETDFTFHAIHAPLEPFKSKVVMPWGLSLTAAGAGEQHAYGMAGLWTAAELHGPEAGADFDGGNGNRTGWGSGASIDQIVAQAAAPDAPYQTLPSDPAQETLYRTIELAVQAGNPTSLTRMIYAGDRAPIHPEENLLTAYERIFGSFVAPNADGDLAARLLAEQRSLLDVVNADFARLRNRVSAEEYPKLEAHLQGLRAIELRLGTTVETSSSCSVPAAPAELPTGRGAANANYPTEARTAMDLITGIFSCDLTRVASVQLSRGFSNVTHDWLGHTLAHHTMSHDGEVDRQPELAQIDAWYAEQVAYLLAKLDSVPEGDGTLLDNTLVVWGRELGNTTHRLQPAPLVLAGSARGRLVTGRFLDVDDEPHVKLLVSIAQLMGLEIDSVGNLQPDSGPLLVL